MFVSLETSNSTSFSLLSLLPKVEETKKNEPINELPLVAEKKQRAWIALQKRGIINQKGELAKEYRTLKLPPLPRKIEESLNSECAEINTLLKSADQIIKEGGTFKIQTPYLSGESAQYFLFLHQGLYLKEIFKLLGAEDLFDPTLIDMFQEKPEIFEVRYKIEQLDLPKSEAFIPKAVQAFYPAVILPAFKRMGITENTLHTKNFHSDETHYGFTQWERFRLLYFSQLKRPCLFNIDDLYLPLDGSLVPQSHLGFGLQALLDNVFGILRAENLDSLDEKAWFWLVYYLCQRYSCLDSTLLINLTNKISQAFFSTPNKIQDFFLEIQRIVQKKKNVSSEVHFQTPCYLQAIFLMKLALDERTFALLWASRPLSTSLLKDPFLALFNSPSFEDIFSCLNLCAVAGSDKVSPVSIDTLSFLKVQSSEDSFLIPIAKETHEAWLSSQPKEDLYELVLLEALDWPLLFRHSKPNTFKCPIFKERLLSLAQSPSSTTRLGSLALLFHFYMGEEEKLSFFFTHFYSLFFSLQTVKGKETLCRVLNDLLQEQVSLSDFTDPSKAKKTLLALTWKHLKRKKVFEDLFFSYWSQALEDKLDYSEIQKKIQALPTLSPSLGIRILTSLKTTLAQYPLQAFLDLSACIQRLLLKSRTQEQERLLQELCSNCEGLIVILPEEGIPELTLLINHLKNSAPQLEKKLSPSVSKRLPFDFVKKQWRLSFETAVAQFSSHPITMNRAIVLTSNIEEGLRQNFLDQNEALIIACDLLKIAMQKAHKAVDDPYLPFFKWILAILEKKDSDAKLSLACLDSLLLVTEKTSFNQLPLYSLKARFTVLLSEWIQTAPFCLDRPTELEIAYRMIQIITRDELAIETTLPLALLWLQTLTKTKEKKIYPLWEEAAKRNLQEFKECEEWVLRTSILIIQNYGIEKLEAIKPLFKAIKLNPNSQLIALGVRCIKTNFHLKGTSFIENIHSVLASFSIDEAQKLYCEWIEARFKDPSIDALLEDSLQYLPKSLSKNLIEKVISKWLEIANSSSKSEAKSYYEKIHKWIKIQDREWCPTTVKLWIDFLELELIFAPKKLFSTIEFIETHAVMPLNSIDYLDALEIFLNKGSAWIDYDILTKIEKKEVFQAQFKSDYPNEAAQVHLFFLYTALKLAAQEGIHSSERLDMIYFHLELILKKYESLRFLFKITNLDQYTQASNDGALAFSFLIDPKVLSQDPSTYLNGQYIAFIDPIEQLDFLDSLELALFNLLDPKALSAEELKEWIHFMEIFVNQQLHSRKTVEQCGPFLRSLCAAASEVFHSKEVQDSEKNPLKNQIVSIMNQILPWTYQSLTFSSHYKACVDLLLVSKDPVLIIESIKFFKLWAKSLKSNEWSPAFDLFIKLKSAILTLPASLKVRSLNVLIDSFQKEIVDKCFQEKNFETSPSFIDFLCLWKVTVIEYWAVLFDQWFQESTPQEPQLFETAMGQILTNFTLIKTSKHFPQFLNCTHNLVAWIPNVNWVQSPFIQMADRWRLLLLSMFQDKGTQRGQFLSHLVSEFQHYPLNIEIAGYISKFIKELLENGDESTKAFVVGLKTRFENIYRTKLQNNFKKN